MSKIHQRNFPDANPQTFIAVFVFLRLYCPAITAPHLYGIYEGKHLNDDIRNTSSHTISKFSNIYFSLEPPESNVQRTLILLSKVLQNLANGILFGKKENYMVKLNEFITSNTDTMKSFVQELLVITINLHHDDNSKLVGRCSC